MPRKRIWIDYDSWREYGIENEFNKRNANELKRSRKKRERSWYQVGSGHKWVTSFQFNFKIEKREPWNSEKEWMEYGLSNGFDKRCSTEIARGKNKEAKYWIHKGKRKGWTKNFEFMKYNNFFRNFEMWQQYGLNNGFDKMNPSKLSRSKDKRMNSWYQNGNKKGWLDNFKLTLKNRSGGIWRNLDYTLSEAEKVINKKGWNTIPSSGDMTRNGYSSLAYAISHYHGGFPVFREKLRAYMSQPSSASQLENFLLEYVGEDNGSK